MVTANLTAEEAVEAVRQARAEYDKAAADAEAAHKALSDAQHAAHEALKAVREAQQTLDDLTDPKTIQ